MKRHTWKGIRLTRMDGQVLGDPAPTVEELTAQLQRAAYDRDQAAAESARIKRELEDIRKTLPTDDQRQRWAELEQQHAKAEEDRMKKAGEFESWRTQVTDRHTKEVNELTTQRENEAAARAKLERELEDELIGREFANAVDLFGPSPTSKTVMIPQVAQSYFAKHVSVATEQGADGRTIRRVVVKDHNGAVIVDTRTGKPQEFAKAMAEVIDAHPQKAYLLRNSGKVGANNSGGAFDGEGGIDVSKLKPSDFARQDVREAVRKKQSGAGGLQIGPGFDRLRQRSDK